MGVKNNKQLEIIVTSENKQEFINFYTTVKNFADSGINVPAPYVKRLLELMHDPMKIRKNLSWKEALQCSKIAIEKISKLKNYQFHWTDTVIEGSDEIVKNDTSKVFIEIIYAFFLFKNDYEKIDKDDVIAFFYQAFDDEYKNRLEQDDQKEFTSRRQAITSGILAMSVGYKLTSKSDLTDEEIFQSTRNSIKKYLKD